jgi:acetyl esterase
VPLDPCFDALLADRRIHLRPPQPPVTLQDLRAGANQFMRAAMGPPVARVEPVTFAAPDGRVVPGRAYRPAAPTARPAIVFLHGGGFVFGDLDTHDAICRALATSSDCTVLAVDYRLAPEHPFPAALHDAVAALCHVGRAPDAFGVLPGAIGLAADSAGAHVAVDAMLETVARPAIGAPAVPVGIAHAALLYPVIDPRCDSPSMHEFARGHMLTREAMRWFWDCYVQRPELRADPRIDVLAANLAGLPPTTIVTAEYDPLRDEGETFARHLAAAGVPVDLERRAGMIHGFAGMPQLTPQAGGVVERLGRALRRALVPTSRERDTA